MENIHRFFLCIAKKKRESQNDWIIHTKNHKSLEAVSDMPFIFMKRKYYQFCYGSAVLEKRIRFDFKHLMAILLNATVSKNKTKPSLQDE